MKKLLGTALSLALALGAGPVGAAELLKNLSFKGGLDLDAISSRNQSDFRTHRNNTPVAAPAANNDRLGNVNTRLWLSGMWDLLDDVHSKVTFRKNDRAWGTNAAGGQGATGSQAALAGGGAATTNVAGNVWIDEANVKVDKLGGCIDTTLGRQFYGDPGDLIAYWGPKDSHGWFVTAIDAARFSASNDWMNFAGLAGKLAGAGVAGVGGADIDVRGIDVGWKGLPVKANTFIWNQVTHGTGALGSPPNNVAGGTSGVNDFLWVYGVKLKGEAAGGWASLTAAANGGSNRVAGAAGGTAASSNYIGKAFLLDAGYKADVANVGGLTPWLNWGWGSGRQNTGESHNEQFTSIASDYRPGEIYGNFSGADPNGFATSALSLGAGAGITGFNGQPLAQPGLGNRIIWGLGLKATPAAWNKLTAGLSYWDYSFQRATAAPGVSPAAVGNRHIGSEADLRFDWAHSENVLISAGYATFQPGGYIKEFQRASSATNQENSPISMFFTDLSVKF